ncbi:MAG: hypothetical protein WCV63_00125 [Negativicutes bacterium]|jgi:hypothetical protein
MKSVITDFDGLTVILRDENNQTQTMNLLDLCELREGDQLTTTIAGNEVPVTIDRFEEDYAVLEFVNPDGSLRTFDMKIRELAGIHIGQVIKSRVLQTFE